MPQTAFISDIEIDQYKIEIVPRGEQHPGKHEEEEAEDQHDHGHYDHQEEDQDEYENFDLFRLPVTGTDISGTGEMIETGGIEIRTTLMN